MQREEVAEFLRRAGWVMDRFGHFQKVITRTHNVTGETVVNKFRIKLMPRVIRVEKQIRLEATEFTKASNEWFRTGGCSYSEARITGGRLQLRTLFLAIPKEKEGD